MTGYQNILVIQTAFIGDAILASGLIEKLHRQFPNAQISILVRKGNESVYHEHPYLKEVLVWNKQQNKFQNLLSLVWQIRKKSFDCVINCHRFASSGFIAGFSGARHIAGYKQNPFSFLFNHCVKHDIGNGKHETERYNELIQDFAPGKAQGPVLYPSQNDYEKVKKYQVQPYVCMAPASVWFTKQLPENKWAQLCAKTDPQIQIFLLGAPSDMELCERIKQAAPGKRIEVLAGKLNLLESCALMQKASMNYVNDSAPLHLASAVNAPVTAFFLSTVTAFGFGPLSDNATVLEVNNLECRPCGLHGYKQCPKGHFNCANNLVI